MNDDEKYTDVIVWWVVTHARLFYGNLNRIQVKKFYIYIKVNI